MNRDGARQVRRYRERSNPVLFESVWPRWVHYLIAFTPLVAFGVWGYCGR